MESLDEVSSDEVKDKVKVFVNGAWVGCFHDSTELVNLLRDFRRNGDISSETSIVHDIINRVSLWVGKFNVHVWPLCFFHIHYMWHIAHLSLLCIFRK